MTSFDTKLRAGMEKLAKKIGDTVTIQTVAYGYTRSTGAGTITPTNRTGQRAFGFKPVSQHYLAAGVAQDGDTQCLLADKLLNYTPALGMIVPVDGVNHTVVHLEKVKASTQIALWILVLRRA